MWDTDYNEALDENKPKRRKSPNFLKIIGGVFMALLVLFWLFVLITHVFVGHLLPPIIVDIAWYSFMPFLILLFIIAMAAS
jgi:hypothetical protein